MSEVNLHATLDAKTWAQEFMRLHGEKLPDGENMLGWFANAIMTGFDEGGRRVLRSVDVEASCEVMHDAYEKAAAGAGWETQAASRKPWSEVPEANKITMRAAVGALLDRLSGIA